MLRWISNLRIRWKILIAPAFLALALMSLGLYALHIQRANQAIVDQVTTGVAQQAELAGAFETAIWKANTHLYRLSATAANESDAKKIAALSRDTATALSGITEKLDALKATTGREEKIDAVVTKMNPLVANYMKQAKTVIEMSDGEAAASMMFMTNAQRSFTALVTLTDDITLISTDLRDTRLAQANAWVEAQQKLLLIIAAVATIIGCLVSLVVSAWIARPIRALTDGMRKLADGDFDVVLPGLGRKDEIGDIAGAVETFKIKSAEKARRDAEAKMELDRIAAVEREAVMAKVMSDLDAAVGGIVQAAMTGDFSKRVPLEGKEGVIRNLAESLNTMCGNVGKVFEDVEHMLGDLAQGDLTSRIAADYQGAFADLKDNANTTAERLSETIAMIGAAAAEVASASGEIAGATTDLSQRTEEQAASLEQTSASMEQISATIKKNSENAQQADQVAGKTSAVASRSGEAVAQAVDAMSRIEASSRKIADIIGVIDEIARQTNLLALNAAVEAARAGEAGRGFAVVASEVRSLAQRSAQAAKDIKDLITSSGNQVQEGVGLVNRAGQSLGEIVESIRNLAVFVSEIARASAEQSDGVDQVNKALSMMDQVTQQNSALVEENAATAKTLEHQAAAMRERVGTFKFDAVNQADDRPAETEAPAPFVRTAAATATRKRTGGSPVHRSNAVQRGPAGRTQSNLAVALQTDPDWKEF
jgi:methyl-accepting chemotaxis protein